MRRGFTLTELLVVVSIIGILAAVPILLFRGYQRTQSLKLAAQKIKSVMNDVYSMSLSPQENGISGYGLYVSAGSGEYKVYKETGIGDHVYTSTDTVVQTGVLLGGVTANTTASVFYGTPVGLSSDLPYERHSYFNGNDAETNGRITVVNSNGETRTVVFNAITNSVRVE